MKEPDKLTCYGCECEIDEDDYFTVNNSDEVYCRVCYDYMIDQGDLAAEAMRDKEWCEEWGEDNYEKA